MTPLELAQHIRTRLADPERFTKGATARRADGRPCRPDDPDAARWCLVGAAMLETIKLGVTINATALRFEFYHACFPGFSAETVATFSDHATHTELLAKLDEGIAWLEGRAPAPPA